MKSTLEPHLKVYAVVENVQLPKNAIWQCFQSQLMTSSLQTRLKAFAEVENVQLRKKRYLALFSESTYEIYSRNAFKGICRSRNCLSSPKTLFGDVFKVNLWNLL